MADGDSSLNTTNPIPEGLSERDSNQSDPIFSEAKRRFAYCMDSESYARKLFIADLKFAEADSDNRYQWPNDLLRNREVEDRPCLTINMTRQHNLQIINDAKQNKPSIKISPTGNGSTAESASAFQDVIRHIEYISNATQAYDHATGYQVKAGLGWWRITTDYSDDDSFDQELYIQPVWDPLSVYLDPDAKLPDKSDANYGFVFQDIAKSVFETIYPEWAKEGGNSPLGSDMYYWVSKDHIKIAEYWRREKVKDVLVAWKDQQTGQMNKGLQSILGEEVTKALLREPAFAAQARDVKTTKVSQYLIVGGKIKQGPTPWLGSTIPLIPLIGEETMIDGVLDRKGHTRALKDPQRIYNYWNSSAVEQVALQTKVPWTGDARAIEGFETYWNTANRVNHSFLPYKGIDDEGNPIPPPVRTQAPQMADAYIQGLQISKGDMESVSGQAEAAMGQDSNERTGRAIAEKGRKAQNSTYHFVDNLGIAVARTGRDLIELIPKIYDTQRVIRCMAEDGTDYEMVIDPKAQQSFQLKRQYNGAVAQKIFNPGVGKYEVMADIGPNYASRREEAWNAYSVILTQAPQLVSIIGDLLFRAGDFPFAEEAAARLKRMLPAQATGEGPSQELLGLQTEMQNLQNNLAAALNTIAVQKGEIKEKDRLRDTGEYDAETKRVQVLLKALNDKDGLKEIVQQLINDTLQTHITTEEELEPAAMPPRNAPVNSAGAPPVAGSTQMSAAPPVPGAKLAPDGQWYVADDQRPGKFLKVTGAAAGSGSSGTPAGTGMPSPSTVPIQS